MKKYMVLMALWSSMLLGAEYKKLQAYADTLYNLLAEYVQTNSTSSATDVLTYLNSNATATVFSDAKNSGYSRKQVILEAYQESFIVGMPNQAIIGGLHDALARENAVDAAFWYSAWTSMGLLVPTIGVLIRNTYIYYRHDHKVIEHYRSNAHRYSTGGSTSHIGTNSSLTTISPLIPEPFF